VSGRDSVVLPKNLSDADGHQMERKQALLAFVDQVKQVGFKSEFFKCGERRCVFDCVWGAIPVSAEV